MNRTINLGACVALVSGLTVWPVLSSFAAPPGYGPRPPGGGGRTEETEGPVLSPAPATVDIITHDQGNIITTIDNYGLVGGHSYYNLPSGEWPRNSGHDYLAEVNYWMGAITAGGDTLVADTYEDFQSIPSLITGVAQNRILLSTDTSRYYDYDRNDTTGAGGGNPAMGWRVWDGEQNDWVYAENYNSTTSSFFEGGPVSVQESHYRFGDNAHGTPLLGLEMTHTALQWNYCYNEDFMYVILEITNTSDQDYTNFAFGLYVDMDIGGPDGTGENGRLGDLVGSDSTESLAWVYDEDGYDPGWGREVTTGFMGTKYLETPGGGGMTAFRTGDWALLPDEDPGKYAMINSEQFDGSLPPTDQYYVQCTRGINLTAGSTVRVVYALVAGQTEADLRANADLAQELYDNYFVGPEPPNTPILTVQAGDEKVYLSWNDTAQHTADPLSGENDFAGYKLYRSDNQGRTWGTAYDTTHNDCLKLDYWPIAKYSVSDPTDPIPRSLIDTNLINGVEYWYCLVAYDTGASATGVDVLQTGFGTPGSASNIVSVTPRTNPGGFYEAAGTVNHLYTGGEEASAGNVVPVVFDRSQLRGDDYQVVFRDTPEQTYWYLINMTSGDTLLLEQTSVNEEPGYYEVAEGLRVVVNNGDLEPRFTAQTGFAGADTTLFLRMLFGPVLPYLQAYDPYFDTTTETGDVQFRSTYELRYTGVDIPTQSLWQYNYDEPTFRVPFECWNTSTNEQVTLAVWDLAGDEVWNPGDPLCIINYPYDSTAPYQAAAFPYHYSWLLRFTAATYNPAAGDVYTIGGCPLNGPDDVFMFSADGISTSRASASLSNIKVVPDPYYAYATWWEVNEGETVLQFQNLPDRCTIRIYTLSGDLVNTLEHVNDTGTEEWNVQNADQRLIVSGIYLYHVESPYGDFMGRFAVVK